jgi:methionyl-tRNA formyltransferase
VPHVVCAYGEVGHEALAELLDLGADVGLVVTHQDAPGEKIWFRSVAALALVPGGTCHAVLKSVALARDEVARQRQGPNQR